MYHLIATSTIALALSACVTQPLEQRDNVDLQRKIYDAVPESWRNSSDSIDAISPLVVSSDLREFIHSRVRSNGDDREQSLALTRAIINRDGIGLLYDPDATHTASEAFRLGTGNCLGFSNLLVASARELGLNADYELVSHTLGWDMVDGVLVGSLHVRVVIFAGGKKMTFDFYPLPLKSGYLTQILSDKDALAHHLNNLAAKAMQSRDNELAYALLSKAIEASPNIAFIWSNLGILLSRQDLNFSAEAAFQEALSISPDTLSALSNLQGLYSKQGRNLEVQAVSDQLAEYRMRNPYHHFQLGEQAFEHGYYQEAVQHIKRAIDLKNTERDFYFLLSKSYAELGLGNAAQRTLRKAQALDKAQPPAPLPRRLEPKTGTRISQ
jgi:Flp pilus assembly protein TadD